MKKTDYIDQLQNTLIDMYQADLQSATPAQLHNALSTVVMYSIAENWNKSKAIHANHRRAYYFSAEFLMGRAVFNNLHCLGILTEIKHALAEKGIDMNALEEAEDAALGNGGLGRLAACFLDSAATHSIPLDGYGLRYRYGLFRQSFKDGFQHEDADDWQKFGDPWSRRRDNLAITIAFGGQTFRAVPYDMPIIGFGTNNIGTLRLWQSEPVEAFDFSAFNDQHYEQAVMVKNAVENITNVLYPNDSTYAGKQLRLKQQYFLSSASLQDIIKTYKSAHGGTIRDFSANIAIQLNDTHPVVSIPELMRLFMLEGMDFDTAFDETQKVFSYTNHTVMSEALEKWDVDLFKSVLPEIFDIIYRINARFCGELMHRNYQDIHLVSIIQGGVIHMASLAVYGSHHVNGVSEVHSSILQKNVLKNYYSIFPERFTSVTNGVTQRRWLGLCNQNLAAFITRRIGPGWETQLSNIAELRAFDSEKDISELNAIKYANKLRLCEHAQKITGVELPPDFIFDVQVKRMHEYKRQLLNIFGVMDIYFGLKDGRIKDFFPTVFLFGAKAAPGYFTTKTIIKYINEASLLINNDPAVNDKMRILFVPNYNCSLAELIIPAADISEQISSAGTEGSGTGNMKFMMNGAVTLGTMDGSNIEIFEEAGLENNYKFGKTVDELTALRQAYVPRSLYENEPRINRILDTLIDDTFACNKTGLFQDLFNGLVNGYGYNGADPYFVLLELLPYVEKKLEINRDYQDRVAFGRKCLANIAASSKFSSDRMLLDYCKNIWHISSVKE